MAALSADLPLLAPRSRASRAISGGTTFSVASGLCLRHSRVKVPLPIESATVGGSSLTGVFQLKGAAFSLPPHSVSAMTVGLGWSRR